MIKILTSEKQTVTDSLTEKGKSWPTVAISLRFRLARLKRANYPSSKRFSSCRLNELSLVTPVRSVKLLPNESTGSIKCDQLVLKATGSTSTTHLEGLNSR